MLVLKVEGVRGRGRQCGKEGNEREGIHLNECRHLDPQDRQPVSFVKEEQEKRSVGGVSNAREQKSDRRSVYLWVRRAKIKARARKVKGL